MVFVHVVCYLKLFDIYKFHNFYFYVDNFSIGIILAIVDYSD